MTTDAENAVREGFVALDEALKLDPQLRKDAQKRHNAVRDCLSEAGLTSGGFLQGSFARATMLTPLKDVDTVNLIAPAWREVAEAPGGVQKMFDQFQLAVQDEWPSARFDVKKQAGKALAVTFRDCDFTLDLSAALPTGNDDVVLLGNRDVDADEEWQPSLTRKLARLVAQRNKDTNGVFVHQVRVLKTAKRLHKDLEDVDGIVFESVAYWSVELEMPFADAIARSLRSGAQMLGGPMPDPANEGDLTASWSARDRATVVAAFERLAEQAETAVAAARANNVSAALSSWRAVVGADFGEQIVGSQEALAQWSVGSRDPALWGAEHSSRRVPATPGRSWRAR